MGQPLRERETLSGAPLPESFGDQGGRATGAIHYRGRKAARAKSEHRRRQILEATLRIAAKDGIRGVKHRPVAREAGVPLASTTYYFKDIEELICDAFTLFAEKAQADLERFYDTLEAVLDTLPPAALVPGGAGRTALAERLAAIAVAYLSDQFTARREEILAEQVFLLEALREPRLAEVAQTYRRAWAAGLARVLTRLQTPNPDRDAAMMVSVVLGLGYDGMLFGKHHRREHLETTVNRLVRLVLAG